MFHSLSTPRSLSCQMRHSEFVGGLHIQGKVRPLVEVIAEKRIETFLEHGDVFWGIRAVAQALFPENPIEAFDEGLLILPVGSSGADERNPLLRQDVPLVLELGSAITLDTFDGAKEVELLLQRFGSGFGIQPVFQDHGRFFREGVNGREGKDFPEVHRVRLDDFPWFCAPKHLPALRVLLPFATELIAFPEDSVDRAEGSVLTVLLLQKVPDLLSATLAPRLTDCIDMGFDEDVGCPMPMSPFGLPVPPNERRDAVEANPREPPIDRGSVVTDFYRDGLRADPALGKLPCNMDGSYVILEMRHSCSVRG